MNKIAIIFCFITVIAHSQTSENFPPLFETPFYEAVDKWILIELPNEDNSFALGFIYIDQEAGFTLDMEATLTLENGKLVNPDEGKKKNNFTKFRLGQNTGKVHILTKQELLDLNLTTPDWLEIYKKNSETDAYKIDIASFYNSAGGNGIAVDILKDLYVQNKTNKKLLFELAYGYNAQGMYAEALNVLEVALTADDTDDLFYKEKHFALVRLGNMKAAKTCYDTYLKKASNMRYRSEMLYNMTYVFFEDRNRGEFDHWATELRALEKGDHIFIKNIDLMIEYWDKPQN